MRIGELAALIGVSTRTVRHYHHQGVLPEPARRPNGYREYGLRDAVRLARVRRLTELGLSLDEVRDVLSDDLGRELGEILAALDADLHRQEEEIRTRRGRLAVLLRQAEQGVLPEEGPLSPELADLFAQIGRAASALPAPEPAMAAKDREVLALIETVAPAEAREGVLGMVRAAAGEPEAVRQAYAVYALLEALVDAPLDDPRIARAAQAVAECVPDEVVAALSLPSATDTHGSAVTEMLFADLAPAQSAAIQQAMTLLAERAEGLR
ncbi:MerR family transcriptional regulator [Streptomyces silvisoli]|uniref:MerR family transcriptional regulator n=1 Tax=Streptomyces silvisoli TaxID=3034235 RepID=A0ABT5ZJL4_9ACTN|nr:MerR family transcriptional regulator [Streptomyces silvisoli]MDF3289764.1 MerR family transcriptional regulator [Streptomyces silvisoli]